MLRPLSLEEFSGMLGSLYQGPLENIPWSTFLDQLKCSMGRLPRLQMLVDRSPPVTPLSWSSFTPPESEYLSYAVLTWVILIGSAV